MTTKQAAERILLSDIPHGRELREWALNAYLGTLQLAPLNGCEPLEPREYVQLLAKQLAFDLRYDLGRGAVARLREVPYVAGQSQKISRMKIVRNDCNKTLREAKEIVEAAEKEGLL